MGQNYDICPNWTTFASKFPATHRLTRSLLHSIRTADATKSDHGRRQKRNPSPLSPKGRVGATGHMKTKRCLSCGANGDSEGETRTQGEAVKEMKVFLVVGAQTVGVHHIAVLVLQFLVRETGAEGEVLVFQTGHCTAVESAFEFIAEGGDRHTGAQSDEGAHRESGGNEEAHVAINRNERCIGKGIVARHEVVETLCHGTQAHIGKPIEAGAHGNGEFRARSIFAQHATHFGITAQCHIVVVRTRHRRGAHRTAIDLAHFVTRTQLDACHISQTIHLLRTALSAHSHRFTVIDANDAATQFLAVAQIDHIGIETLSSSGIGKATKQGEQEENLFHL